MKQGLQLGDTGEKLRNIQFRALRPHERIAFLKTEARGFGEQFRPSADELDLRRKWFDASRTVCAFDNREIVGTSAAFSLQLPVPGGHVLPFSAVTSIAVSASHRRQGILTEIMRRLLENEYQMDIPVAGLWASESVIYGRFGYGMAIQEHAASIRTRHASFRRPLNVDGKVRFADASEVRSIGPRLWSKAMASRPGMIDRGEFEWDSEFRDQIEGQGRFYVVYEEKGDALGYAKYRLKSKTELMPSGAEDQYGSHEMSVIELVATTETARAAIWRFLLDIDLVYIVTHWHEPMNSSLLWLLKDPRRLSLKPYDALWLRFLDPAAALSARKYTTSGSATFELIDDFCPWAGGRFKLEVDKSGDASCTRTNDHPDASMPTASMSAVYLGAQRLTMLSQAGRVEEHEPGAVAKLDAMFATSDVHSVVHEF